MSVYKPCDIRGHVATEITPDLYRSWGRTLGEQLKPKAKFVVGGDQRLSTPEFLGALVDGLCQSGVDVVDLGLLPTPMIYYAKDRLLGAACAIVTASHNPPDFNGLKWMLGDRPPTEEQVHLLSHGVETAAPASARRPPSTPRPLDVTFDYVAWLQEFWVESRAASCHVALDPMHGSWAGRGRRYLHAVFPRLIFSTVHDTPHPVFDGRNPDCSRPELLDELCEEVYRQRADVGIAFDGDGDRIALVDNEGTPLTAEETTWVLLQTFGQKLQGKQFVYDQKFSGRVPEAAEELGAEALVERSGHAFIRARMLDSAAVFGAEISGHYFYGDLRGGDDGLFTACRMIAHLAGGSNTLAQLRRECPAVFITPDLRVRVEPQEGAKVIQKVRSAWSQYPQATIDGVRVSFPDGWALVRNSVTEPVLTFRFEASDLSGLYKLVWDFCDVLGELGDALWGQYAEAMGTSGAD